MFVKDYAKIASPINRLLRNGVPFQWLDEEIASMEKLKEAIKAAPCLQPINYDWDTEVVLAVDTSWQAVGFYIYQAVPGEPKKKNYC